MPMPFLLTRPLRDVTDIIFIGNESAFISTHTPLAGRDMLQSEIQAGTGIFLLTRPLRDVT